MAIMGYIEHCEKTVWFGRASTVWNVEDSMQTCTMLSNSVAMAIHTSAKVITMYS